MIAALDPREHRAGVLGTVVVHLLLVAGLVAMALTADPPPSVIYQVNLVAAPAAREAPRRAAESATPTARVPEAPPEKAPAKVPEKPPEPVKTPDKVVRNDPTLQTRSDVTPLPDVTPSTGNAELTFTQAGIRFQDQAYLDNIVTQIRRRWSNPAGSGSRLSVDVSFTIQRDGTVTDVKVARPSTNFTFNTSARGAIERAASEKAFGPLPASYNGESLPVSFSFAPEKP